MFKKPVICFLTLIILLSGATEVFAYAPKTTHAALTQEVVEFYNLLYPDKKLTQEETEWLIKGSIDEDRDVRAINHFYDPVYKIGWTAEGIGSFSASEVGGFTSAFIAPEGADVATAVRWANDRNLQSRYYSRYGGDRTWTQALEYFYSGNEKEAYYTLGHVLHLVEDMAVPAHTRNDPHPPTDESPYETYADKKWNRNSINELDIPNKLIKEGAALPSASSIESYLHSMASYSNKHFFSKDTINNPTYELKVDENSCDGKFCYGVDEKGIRFPLAKIKKVKDGLEYKNTYLIEKSDEYIFYAYFTRLAEKSVLHGVAVLNLFYNDARDFIPARVSRFNEKSLLGKTVGGRISFIGELSLVKNKFLSFFANIGDSIAGIFSGSPDIKVVEIFDETPVWESQEVETVGEIVPDGTELKNTEDDEFDRLSEMIEEPAERVEKEQVQAAEEENKEETIVEVEEESEEEEVVQNQGQSQAVVSCGFGSSAISPISPIGPIIINEVAWMGTADNSNGEWIELKNISTLEVEISGWQILDKAEQIKIVFENGTKIPPLGFYLLERTSDNSLPGVAADVIYTGALGNADEGLRLFNSACGLVDEVIASPDWPAGSNSSKGTMERKKDLTWQSSAFAGGTPKNENSVPALIVSGGDGSGYASAAGIDEAADDETSTSSTSTASVADHVLISEFVYDAEGADLGNEFVEFYNPTGADLNLDGWSLRLSYSDSTSSDSLASFGGKPEDVTSIKTKGFLLVGLNGNSVGDINRSANLPQVDGVLYTITLFDNSGVAIDRVDYDSTSAPEKSLERRAFEEGVCFSAQGDGEFLGNGCDTNSNDDFNVRLVSKSQNSESLPEPRDAPTAVADFSVGYHFSAPTLILNWDESQDYTRATSSVTYEIEEFNTPTSSIPFNLNATSTALEQVIDEIGRDYEFTIKAVDIDGLASTSTVASTTVPSFVDNLYFYHHPDASSTEYLIDLYYTDYPFVPDPYWNTPEDDWKILVFYHNTDAIKGGNLLAPAWNPVDLTNILAVEYKECSSGSLATNYRMILPDNSGRCGVGGGLNNNARVWEDLEDNHLLIRIASSTDEVIFEDGSDYLTVAFYSFSDSGAGNQTLSLVAVDKTKYYFQSSPPSYGSPSSPTDLTVDSYTTNSPTSTVGVSWVRSTDSDSLDDNISYELSWDNSNWESLTLTSGADSNRRYANLYAALDTTSTVHIRAADDFGTVSAAATTSLALPETVTDTTPDPSNPYFAVDEAKIDEGLLKIKWRFIKAPNTNLAFGIIPFLSADGTPASLDGFRSLHRDYSGNSYYPLTVARMSSNCAAAMTPIEDYTIGWQYETHFSAIGDVPVSASLVGQSLEFSLYARNHLNEPTCNLGDAVSAPIFTGLPVIIQ